MKTTNELQMLFTEGQKDYLMDLVSQPQVRISTVLEKNRGIKGYLASTNALISLLHAYLPLWDRQIVFRSTGKHR